MVMEAEHARQVEYRRRIADALGSPLERKLARIRLGLTQADVAEATGLSVEAVRLRERRDPERRRAPIEAEVRYAQLIATARGRTL
jgi:DNA-binding XRE family transcriptional regulator